MEELAPPVHSSLPVLIRLYSKALPALPDLNLKNVSLVCLDHHAHPPFFKVMLLSQVLSPAITQQYVMLGQPSAQAYERFRCPGGCTGGSHLSHAAIWGFQQRLPGFSTYSSAARRSRCHSPYLTLDGVSSSPNPALPPLGNR